MSFWYNSPTVIHPANVPQIIRQACKTIASVQTPLCELYIRSVTRKTNVILPWLLYIFFRARSAALLQTIKLFSSIVKKKQKTKKKQPQNKQKSSSAKNCIFLHLRLPLKASQLPLTLMRLT